LFKKIDAWILYLTFVLSIIFAISFGVLVRQELVGYQKFGIISKSALFLAEMPYNLKRIYEHFTIPASHEFTIHNAKYANKPTFKKFISTHRNELLLLPRYNSDWERNVVDIVDLNDFSVLHTFKPDIDLINSKTDATREEYKVLLRGKNKRYFFWNPLITEDGDLIFHSDSPLVKIDFCGNLLWVNDEAPFHHSNNIDHEGNYWAPSRKFPFAVDKNLVGEEFQNYHDDAVTKISPDGKILLQKSVSEILINSGYKFLLFSQQNYLGDPIHLNDIEPVLSDGPYWKQGDVFLSLRNLSMVIHYRPSTDKAINIIYGDFYNQHDVDIISDKEVSIFNNNIFFTNKGRRILSNSEVVVYNFETKKFYQKFAKSMQVNDIQSTEHGLNEILSDGSMLVEERDHGRILMFNPNGKLEWEFVNKDKNGKIHYMWWTRIINSEVSLKLRQKIKNTTCSN
jgi:hypothetical protein